MPGRFTVSHSFFSLGWCCVVWELLMLAWERKVRYQSGDETDDVTSEAGNGYGVAVALSTVKGECWWPYGLHISVSLSSVLEGIWYCFYKQINPVVFTSFACQYTMKLFTGELSAYTFQRQISILDPEGHGNLNPWNSVVEIVRSIQGSCQNGSALHLRIHVHVLAVWCQRVWNNSLK